MKACCEAGPTGYVLYWQLAELGVACEVIMPTLVPMKAGDRVKTDRRDAERARRLTACGESHGLKGFVTGHDFSRAENAKNQDGL